MAALPLQRRRDGTVRSAAGGWAAPWYGGGSVARACTTWHEGLAAPPPHPCLCRPLSPVFSPTHPPPAFPARPFPSPSLLWLPLRPAHWVVRADLLRTVGPGSSTHCAAAVVVRTRGADPLDARQRAVGVPRGNATAANSLRCKARGAETWVAAPHGPPRVRGSQAGHDQTNAPLPRAAGSTGRQPAGQMNHPVAPVLDPVQIGAATWACSACGRTAEDAWKPRTRKSVRSRGEAEVGADGCWTRQAHHCRRGFRCRWRDPH